MKALVLYDSVYGNTAQIAKAIGKGLSEHLETSVIEAKAFAPGLRPDAQLLIVGSPTLGFRPTPPVNKFLNRLTANSLDKILVAGFDTRIPLTNIKSVPLRFMVKKAGYPAKIISNKLRRKGGEMIAEPEGFLISEQQGPLVPRELSRAEAWGKNIGLKALSLSVKTV